MKERRFVASLMLVVGAIGCDSVASDDYPGEVLATIRGLVVDDAAGPPGAIPPLDVALVWGVWEGDAGLQAPVLAQKVAIQGTFPADFELTLRHPPPAGAGVRQGGVTINFAFVAAIDRDTWEPGKTIQAGRSVAAYGNADEAVIHLDREVPDESWATLLGGVRTAGFHLVEMVDPSRMSAAEKQQRIDACRKLAPASEAAMCNDLLEPGAYYPRLAPGDLQHRIRMEVSWEPTILGGAPDPGPEPDPGAGGLTPGGQASASAAPPGGP